MYAHLCVLIIIIRMKFKYQPGPDCKNTCMRSASHICKVILGAAMLRLVLGESVGHTTRKGIKI